MKNVTSKDPRKKDIVAAMKRVHNCTKITELKEKGGVFYGQCMRPKPGKGPRGEGFERLGEKSVTSSQVWPKGPPAPKGKRVLKEYDVEVGVSGTISLKIRASSSDEAFKKAGEVADRAVLSSDAYEVEGVFEANDSLECDVQSITEEEG
jgi:hypothetical protein